METTKKGRKNGFLLKGLNRTMQYGNAQKHKMKHKAKYSFKSYYVVWKQKPHT